MAKKDFHNTGENIDRGKKEAETMKPQIPDPKNKPEEAQITEVKNASASGLGTIGRNDQQETKNESNY
jgi:hypothetical protein